MKRKILLLVPFILLFLAKYIQVYASLSGSRSAFATVPMLLSAAISLVSGISIALFSYLLLEDRWRRGSICVALLAVASTGFYFLLPGAPLYLLYNLLLATSLLVFLYPFHHYEIRKYLAFGYSFLVIYMLTEGISLWRGEYDPRFFAAYLTLSLVMFVPGFINLRDMGRGKPLNSARANE